MNETSDHYRGAEIFGLELLNGLHFSSVAAYLPGCQPGNSGVLWVSCRWY